MNSMRIAAIVGGVACSAMAAGPARMDEGGPYAVVCVGAAGEDEAWRAVAEKAAAFHHGTVIEFDGVDFGGLRAKLAEMKPENVLFVVKPEQLDVNFQRRVLGISHGLDSDIFADFAWGYFTARDGAALAKLWERTLVLHERGLANKTWMEIAVTSGTKSFAYEDGASPLEQAAGFHGPHYYFAEIGSDPDVLKFVDQNLSRLETASVISMSGNGDPEGIWLFSGNRNLDPAKHWAYDPAKIGRDPDGVMPRITADRFRALRLHGAVVWSGTCHCAAPRRVYVEGDIVSTFGKADGTPVYEMKPDESMCLAVLDAGAAAFIAPIGANHGFSASIEQDFALTTGASLGEAIKSTYDDVLLACEGNLRLGTYAEGKAGAIASEPVMQGGGANRILIGDPALRPFGATKSPTESATVAAINADELEIVVDWKPVRGVRTREWDLYGEDRARDYRVWARVPLEGLAGADAGAGVPKLSASVKVTDEGGNVLPYVLKHAAAEEYHGKRWVYVQANVERKLVEGKGVRAVFAVKMK